MIDKTYQNITITNIYDILLHKYNKLQSEPYVLQKINKVLIIRKAFTNVKDHPFVKK